MAARFRNSMFMLVAVVVVITIGLSHHQRFRLSRKTVTKMSRTRINASLITQSNPLIIWNTDSHPVPPLDVRWFLEPMGARVLQHDFSGYCHFFNLCEAHQKVKVLTMSNYRNAREIRSDFFAAYRGDPEMDAVDAFLCTDVIAICQLYIQFKKPIIIVATNRYYVGRVDADDENNPNESWFLWNKELKQIASNPQNVVVANNLYDVHFMRYFTGIEPLYLPTYAGYTNASYNPSNPDYILARNRLQAIDGSVLNDVRSICAAKAKCQASLGTVDDYQYTNLVTYRGIVHIPYQVSTTSIFEQYRMNIPLFFPSKSLLIKWDLAHWLLQERTVPPKTRSPRNLPPHPSQQHLPSPTDETNATAMAYWLQFADYYTMPHIQYFDSEEHLAQMLCTLTLDDLRSISKRMHEYNMDLKKNLTESWRKIFLNVAEYSPKFRI